MCALEQENSTFPLTALPGHILSRYLISRSLKEEGNVSVYSRALRDTINSLVALRPDVEPLRDEYTRKLCIATTRHYNPSLYALLLTAHGGTAIRAPPLLSNVLAASLILELDDIFEDCMKARARIDVWQPLFGHPIELAVEKDDMAIIRYVRS